MAAGPLSLHEFVKPKPMSIKQALKQSGGKKRKGMAFLVTAFFFISIAGLYGALGTFLSSCGTPIPVATNIYMDNYNGWGCVPGSWGSYVDFEGTVYNGWKVNVLVYNGSTTYSNYDFGPSLTSGTATIDDQFIKGVEVPQNASYRIKITVRSYCNCSSALKMYEYGRTTDLFGSGQIASYIGTLGAPYEVNCY